VEPEATAAGGRSGTGAAIAKVAKKRAVTMRSAFIACLFVYLLLEEICVVGLLESLDVLSQNSGSVGKSKDGTSRALL